MILRRRINQITLALATFIVLACVGMIVTTFIDDTRIASARGTSVATVVDVSPLRTTVRYPDADGTYHQPDAGLKYPIGLIEGQRVRVDYQIGDPDNVKVQGRAWTLSFLPALSSMVVLLLVVLGIWGLLTWSLAKFAPSVTRRQPTRDVERED